MPVVMKSMKCKKKSGSAQQYTHFSAQELAQLQKGYEDGETPSVIADDMDRSLSAVCRRLEALERPSKMAAPVGRPPALTEKQKELLVQTAASMTQAADAKYQVTLAMVLAACKLKVGERTARDALHKHGVYFRPLREKPVRTEDDEKARLAFGKKYEKQPAEYWEKQVDGYLDNKSFEWLPTHAARTHAAKRTAKGTYRKKGEGLAQGHVKPSKTLKEKFGQRVQVSVAISSKKVLMCHVVDGAWNKGAACDMYANSLAPALRAAYPRNCLLYTSPSPRDS